MAKEVEKLCVDSTDKVYTESMLMKMTKADLVKLLFSQQDKLTEAILYHERQHDELVQERDGLKHDLAVEHERAELINVNLEEAFGNLTAAKRSLEESKSYADDLESKIGAFDNMLRVEKEEYERRIAALESQLERLYALPWWKRLFGFGKR